MLPYILAIAIAIYSLSLFGQAFLSPVIHRKDDFLWSGVGLFYALVLWLCAERITGAVLLGQSAVTILVISFGRQVINLRRAIAYPDRPREEFSVTQWMQTRLSSRKKPTIAPPPQSTTLSEIETPVPSENEDQTTETVAQEILETAIEENLPISNPVESETEKDVIGVTEVTQSPKLPQPQIEQKKGFSLKNMLGLNKKPAPQSKSKITQAEDEQKEIVQIIDRTTTPEGTRENRPEDEFESFVADEGAETIIEAYRGQEIPSENRPEDEFETFVTDEGAETIIEAYRPELTTSEPIESQETQLPTDKSESEAKDDKEEKNE